MPENLLEVVIIVPNMNFWNVARHIILGIDVPQKQSRYGAIIDDRINLRCISEWLIEDKLRGLNINAAFLYCGPLYDHDILLTRFRENPPIVISTYKPEEIQKELIILLGKGGPGTPQTWQEYVERRSKNGSV